MCQNMCCSHPAPGSFTAHSQHARILLLSYIQEFSKYLIIDILPKQARPTYTYVSPPYKTVSVSSPLLGFINTIGYKLSNTAEFLAGLMTKTVQVIKGFNARLAYPA